MAPIEDSVTALTARSPLHNPFPLVLATLLVGHSVARGKLTLLAGGAAFATAILHVAFPSNAAWVSLILFFAAGTLGTRVGKAAKSHLTLSSTGGSGAEGARNAVQVLSNSGAADLIILTALICRPTWLSRDRAVFGIVCAYAAAAADTLSSELGILAKGQPFMVMPPFRRVSRGTNGGVTTLGLGAGLLGGGVLGVVHLLCNAASIKEVVAVAVLGLAGSVLDSVLGATLQMTVEDKKSGRVVEGANGKRVLVKDGGSRVRRGADLLNNNGVNFLMATVIGLVGLGVYPSLRA